MAESLVRFSAVIKGRFRLGSVQGLPGMVKATHHSPVDASILPIGIEASTSS